LKVVLENLEHKQRLAAWVGAMRRAGGLHFLAADEEVRLEIFEIEQTTPENQRTFYRDGRDYVLGAHAPVSMVMGISWLRSEALLSKAALGIALAVLSPGSDGPAALREALLAPAAEGAAASPRPKKRRAQGEPTGSELLQEFGRLLDLVLVHDDSDLAQYWLEMLGMPGRSQKATPPASLEALLTKKREAILRPVPFYLSEAAAYASFAVRVRDLAIEKAQWNVDLQQCWLPPIDAYLDRNEHLLQQVRKSTLYHPAEIPGADRILASFETVLKDPKSYARTQGLIYQYEQWLYPAKDAEWRRRQGNIKWRPWEDHYGWTP
jgi:hypothetical protein